MVSLNFLVSFCDCKQLAAVIVVWAASGVFSPTSVRRCMIQRIDALSNGSTKCMVQPLPHMITS